MITSRSKCRPANRSFTTLTLLTFGPIHPNHQCTSLSLVICTRALLLTCANVATLTLVRFVSRPPRNGHPTVPGCEPPAIGAADAARGCHSFTLRGCSSVAAHLVD